MKISVSITFNSDTTELTLIPQSLLAKTVLQLALDGSICGDMKIAVPTKVSDVGGKVIIITRKGQDEAKS